MRPVLALVASILLALAAATPAAAQLVPGLGSLGSGSGGEAEAESGTGSEAGSDPVQLLLQILQDDEARSRLVEQLQAAAEPEEEAAEPAPERPQSFGRRIAEVSERVAGEVADWAGSTAAVLGRVPTLMSGISGEELDVIFDALRSLLLVIGATIAVFVSLRALAIPFYRRIGARAAERPAVQRILPFLGAGVTDVAIVLVSWAAGYVLALVFFSEAAGIELRQILYLNAFLAVELVKTLMRLLLSPSTAALRLIRVSDWGARRLYRVLRTVISLVGYTTLLVLPILVDTVGFLTARNVVSAIWIGMIVYLIGVAIYYRRPVSAWLLAQFQGPTTEPTTDPTTDPATDPTTDPAEAPAESTDETGAATTTEPARKRGRFLKAIVSRWHWVALLWLLWLLMTVLGRRYGAVEDLRLVASSKVAAVLVLGLVVSGALGRLVERGITLPQNVTQRVPLLETRINRYVPRILMVLRLLVLAGVIFYSIEALSVGSARGLVGSDFGLRFTGTMFSIIAILLMTFAVWLALTSWVDYRLNPDYGDVPTAREQTLLTLLRNAATIALLILTLMFVLSEIGLNIGPLLASAGVVGLAIGFGAQKMVQDIITGIFIQFENAINVGDVVTAGGITGAVERLTVRSVSLRTLDGTYHIIPFSSVDTVSNFTRDFSYYVVDMGVAYRENVPEVKQAMHDAYAELRSDPQHGGFLLGDLEWFGLDSFGDNAVVLKCRLKSWPGQQWGVGRAYNEILKRIFDERGIEIPFPQRSVWFGEDRSGNAPPLRVAGRMQTEGAADRPQAPSGETPHAVRPTQDAPTDGDGD